MFQSSPASAMLRFALFLALTSAVAATAAAHYGSSSYGRYYSPYRSRYYNYVGYRYPSTSYQTPSYAATPTTTYDTTGSDTETR